MTTDLDTPAPDLVALQADIAETRAALERKIEEIERRLDPRRLTAKVRGKLDPQRYLGWIALAAVAVGSIMAARGLRPSRESADVTARECLLT